jgi:hypothetical protein
MKFTTREINSEKLQFKPFDLIISIESLNDLADFYARFNKDRNLKDGFTDSSPIGLSDYYSENDSYINNRRGYEILKKKCEEVGFKFNW